ncbi:hypothetical protein [Sanguibacter sp. 25GB23B1]
MTTTRTRTPLVDVLRREAYLARLSLFMDDLPRARRRSIYRDLRAELTAAADDSGMTGAVRDLGPAAVLAHGYREAEGRPLPRWTLGALVAGGVVALWVFTTLTYAMGLLDASRSATAEGDATVVTTGSYLWNDITARSSADSISVESTGIGFLLMLVAYGVVTFVVARGWRAWTR